MVPVADGDMLFLFAFGLAHRNANSELRYPSPRLSTLPQLPFGLEPMRLTLALFLSPRHPNLVGLYPDCLLRWGRFLGV
jgi:hypothetical protein